jgi:hypothetical protein
MGVLKSVSFEAIKRAGSISEADVLAMRRSFYEDGLINPTEAEQLFALNDTCAQQHDTWAWFFVEALTDFVVNQTAPEGYVTAENADWLIAHISKDGRVQSKTELDLLVNVLDKARWSPERLVKYAMEQVKFAVIEGDGPLRNGQTLEKGTINDAEVDLLRRVLYAFAGDGNIAITKTEAEILFEIDEAMAGKIPSAAWVDLFSKAIANVILSASGYAPPSREEALRAEAWLSNRGDLSPLALLKAMISSSLSSVWDIYHGQSAEERALERLERQRIEIITNEQITDAEASWVAERISRDGRLTPTELALISYLRQESPLLHPSLSALVARFGAAA